MDGEVISLKGQRTEEERLRGDALVLRFGDTVTSVSPLTIRKSREWKKALVQTLDELSGLTFDDLTKGQKMSADAVKNAIGTMALQIPEKLEALVWDYLRLAGVAAPDIDALLDVATDQNVTEALWVIFQATFPFFWKVGDLIRLAESITP